MVRMMVQLTEDQMQALKRLSQARGVSMAELLRQGADLVLRGRHGSDRATRWQRARSFVGAFTSRHRDLAKRHDAHLAEAYRT